MLRRLLRRLMPGGRAGAGAAALYAAIVAQARQPAFYAELRVPDTVMGRYEMIALHVIVVLDRLLRLREQASAAGDEAGAQAAHELARALQEAMFDSLDAALREMGVSDPAMPKRMEKLVSLFYGQMKTARVALALLDAGEERGHEALRRMLARNIFVEDASAEDGREVAVLADYVARLREGLASRPLGDLAAGRVEWPQVRLRREVRHG